MWGGIAGALGEGIDGTLTKGDYMEKPSLLTRNEAIQSILKREPCLILSQLSNVDIAELYAALHDYTDEELLIIGVDPTV